MLAKIAATVILAGALTVPLSGCKKQEPSDKTGADYKAEARRQIDGDNFLSELDSLEESIGRDIEESQTTP